MLKMLSGWSIVVHSSAVEDHIKDSFEDTGGFESNPSDCVRAHRGGLVKKNRS